MVSINMKQIPNLFTLLNLVFGCLAIVMVLQTGDAIVTLDTGGSTLVVLPEKIWQGCIFIFAAAVIDFLDGFLARAMKASSEMGKQLDSLSDVVSFGVAPGMILYQLLRMGYARGENGLDVSIWALIPAFLFTAAVAWRLAKFNITSQVTVFRGVPSPAAGLLIASFPMIIRYSPYEGLGAWFINPWILYAVIIIVAYLMISDIRFLSMKFTNYSFRGNTARYILLLASIACIIFLGWLAVPVIFLLYVVRSVFFKETTVVQPADKSKTLDVTV
jgi:CDP-diacylglycerol--serine O-phosphatidyltransferase